jgi:hypothetical protein
MGHTHAHIVVHGQLSWRSRPGLDFLELVQHIELAQARCLNLGALVMGGAARAGECV